MRVQPALLSPLVLLAALGALPFTAGTAGAAEAVDTSNWKCSKCPYTQGATGTVDAGAGYTSDDSTTFGNYTGLQKQGLHLVLGGAMTYRSEDGYFADVTASDLGLDIRSLAAEAGRAGQYSLSLGYAEIPRYFAEGARTPFLGGGGNVLTLPAGFPAADTASMPLASTLRPVELGYEARRFDLAGKWMGMEDWLYQVKLRRDVRDGTRPGAGSFFSSAAQFAQPVDQTTDQLELGAAYARGPLQASVSYLLSQFKNGPDALTWANPFNPVVPGATQGQLALAPDNSFQQVGATLGYQISPTMRASADIAYGQGKQNESLLASTVNAGLAPLVPALPAGSLDGQVVTFNFNAKLSAAPLEGLKLNAIYARDVRDNETALRTWPQVATDMFLEPARANVAFDLVQDRIKLNADYRGLDGWKLTGGYDWDHRQRTYTEAVTTSENTFWGRAAWQALEPLALAFNLAWADRSSSTYGTAYWFGAPENPLLRKYNLAPRERLTTGARADWTVSDALSLGLGLDWSQDDYDQTPIGLKESETTSVVADASWVLSEQTRLHAFVQDETIKSLQAGSQAFAAPDWTGRVKDRFQVLGLGIKHAAIADKLDLGADLSFARSRSDTTVQTAAAEPPFPTNKTSLDVVKVYASYKLADNLWLNGSWWYERFKSSDWQLDGIGPATVFNLLALGNAAPRYNVNVLRVSVRYQF